MVKHMAQSVDVAGSYSPAQVAATALHLRAQMGCPASVAFAFVSPDYLPHLEEFCEILRVDGHMTHVVGCTTTGRIESAREIEDGSGFSVLALSCEASEPIILESENIAHSSAEVRASWPGATGWLALTNPFLFAADEWLTSWNKEFPHVPTVGGLASGGGDGEVGVFANGRMVDAVLIASLGKTSILPVISQGCRPIGEPLTVTRAENNVVYALGGGAAYEALESAFQTLSDSEKSNARGNLFAGLAGTEYLDDYKPGDFLIRNIIGADPESGAVVIGGIPRIGQTLQYQLRDRSVAEADLARALAATPLDGRRAFASLLFSCVGRGQKFFGKPHHDAARLASALGGKPTAGFFCNGEIAPVGGKNAVHGYTAAAAIWVES